MTGFLYYLPGRDRSIKLDDVRAAGLGYAFEEEMTPAEMARGGPDGGAGVLVADSTRVPRIAYLLDKQTWRKVPKLNAWCGFYNEQRPGPIDLVRSEPLPGRYVRLGDGNDWLCPVVLGALGVEEGVMQFYDALPAAIGIDDSGEWAYGARRPEHDELWDIAQRFWDQYVVALSEARDAPDKTARFDFAGLNDAALAALTVNYRVGKAEVALLGLFDDRAVRGILEALCDVAGWHELLKKKDADGDSTNVGPQDGMTDTDQPSRTNGC